MAGQETYPAGTITAATFLRHKWPVPTLLDYRTISFPINIKSLRFTDNVVKKYLQCRFPLHSVLPINL